MKFVLSNMLRGVYAVIALAQPVIVLLIFILVLRITLR